ncbi:hypothetical protein [Magnetospirillum fulvum]|uniref:Uncharacterized protein n=1 Tax=Magnetospirillum fulvum TaxID=1082 RepID=A0A1H6I567_MAGFU|nr:hypothetical protein [Magnetospirillum fulvum]SEH43621.1 hypothetical protein SAMN04244559_02299 [Magnetospirillum fulvum]
MTFDIAPDWLELAIGGYFASSPQSQRDSVRSTPAPSCPDRDSLAALVRELCAEGTLSPDQMTMMFDSAELADVATMSGETKTTALA